MYSKKIAIIVAGGTGQRMGSVVPKQFLEIEHKAILLHTIDQFVAAFADIEIVIVLPEVYINEGKKIIEKNKFKNTFDFVQSKVEVDGEEKNKLKVFQKYEFLSGHLEERIIFYVTHWLSQLNDNKEKRRTVASFIKKDTNDEKKFFKTPRHFLRLCYYIKLLNKWVDARVVNGGGL